jgi:hypothetical protein
MNIRHKWLNFKVPIVVLLVALVLIQITGCGGKAKKPLSTDPNSTAQKKLQVMAFYEKGWNDLTFGFPSLQAHYKDISVLMPYWYTLRPDGSIKVSAVGL